MPATQGCLRTHAHARTYSRARAHMHTRTLWRGVPSGRGLFPQATSYFHSSAAEPATLAPLDPTCRAGCGLSTSSLFAGCGSRRADGLKVVISYTEERGVRKGGSSWPSVPRITWRAWVYPGSVGPVLGSVSEEAIERS